MLSFCFNGSRKKQTQSAAPRILEIDNKDGIILFIKKFL